MNIRKSFLCKIAIILVILLACGVAFFYFREEGSKEAEILQVDRFITTFDYSKTDSLVSLVKNSEIVVIGEYTGFSSSWNMARDSYNVLNEDKDNYFEGRLYNFSVFEILKGTPVDDEILVNHYYSRTIKKTESNAVFNENGEIVVAATKTNEISFTVPSFLFIEPDIGSTYVLFLLKDRDFGNYYGTAEPFMIKIEDDKAFLQSNLIDIAGEIVQTVPIDGTSRTISVSENHTRLNDYITGTDFNTLKEEILGIVERNSSG